MPHELLSSDAQIAEFVQKLLDEDDVFHPLKGDREGRATIRREFVRVTRVVFENGEMVEGYCGNISTDGIEIVTQESIRTQSKAIVEVASREPNETYRFIAECRWSNDMEIGGVLSGWRFLHTS